MILFKYDSKEEQEKTLLNFINTTSLGQKDAMVYFINYIVQGNKSEKDSEYIKGFTDMIYMFTDDDNVQIINQKEFMDLLKTLNTFQQQFYLYALFGFILNDLSTERFKSFHIDNIRKEFGIGMDVAEKLIKMQVAKK